MLIRRGIAAAALTLLMSSAAAAQDLSISGEWGDNRGGLIDIPLRGGIALCTSGFGEPLCPNVTLVGNAFPVQQVLGGIPVRELTPNELLPVSAVEPGATLTIPPGIFTQPNLSSFVPVPSSPTVVQLNTTFVWNGPLLEADITGATPNIPPGMPANMLAPNAPSQQPNRPFDATAASTTTGTIPNNVQITYVKGPNQFGGTMQGMLMGGGSLILTGGALPPNAGAVQPLANAPNGMTVTAGGTWRRNFPGGQPAGSIRSTIMIANPCTPSPFNKSCSTVTGLGDVIQGLTSATAQNYGFPWTTGTVRMSRTGTVGGGPATSMISAMGGDALVGTEAGDGEGLGGGPSRQIQLVSAAMSLRTDTASGTSGLNNFDGVQIIVPEPQAALALAGALAAIAALFALRRRI